MRRHSPVYPILKRRYMNQNKLGKSSDNFAAIRKLFFLGIIISIMTGAITIAGMRLKLYDQETGTVLGIIMVIATFSLIVGRISKLLGTADRIRSEASIASINAQNELSANQLIYKNLIENAGVVMYTTSIDGCITFASSKAFHLTGYSLAELIGMHFTKLIAEDCLEEVKVIYKNQVKNNLEETVNEFRIQTKNGGIKWVEQSAILVSENGVTTGFQCLVKDITERKEMEAILRKYEVELVQNQDRLQSILDNATSLMYIKDLEGRYLLVNRQFKEALNVTENTVIGKTDFDFADRKQAMRYKYSDDEVFRTRKPVQLEEIIDMEDGQHHILIMKFPLLDANKEIYGISGIATDITERVKYEEQLIQAKKMAEDAKKMQEQFLANMSHEIRTPMNGIQGMTDLLLETRLNDEQKDFAITIKRSSDNLLVIINDILDFSKIQAGKLTLEKIDFKLREIIDNVKAIFKPRILDKRIFFDFNIDKNIPGILNGDPYRLNQILVNLIGNAVKFTQSGGITVQIGIQNKSSDEITLEFRIADTGIGITDDNVNEIFESFTQASIETSRKYGGTGLGLAITKQLLEMQRGSISVESKINSGTTFKFSIPYSYSDAESPMLFASKNVNNYSSLLEGKKFLVAEDNEVNQKVIRHVLQKAGGIADIANNGAEAVFYLKKNSDYDLIIMDLQMPEMDGYAATKYIRNEMHLTIPIVAMTASALKGEKSRCLEIGMNDYLSKPFDFTFLYKRITYFLDNSIPKKIPFMPNEQTTHENLFDLSQIEMMDDAGYTIEVLTLFFYNSPAELSELKKACLAQNFEAVKKLAHKLKGSAGIVQANGLIKILLKLEEFAKAGINEGLTVLAEQADAEYKKIEVPLKEYVKQIAASSHVSK